MATAVQEGNGQQTQPETQEQAAGQLEELKKLYSQASKTRGNEDARKQLKELTPQARELIAPDGLKGKARETFVKVGKTFSEQQEEAQAKRQAKKPAGSVTSSGVSPKQMAEELGITPRQFRVFLRSQKLGVGRGKRYGFPKVEARKIINAYKKAHKD